jgi:hypothetical protein
MILSGKKESLSQCDFVHHKSCYGLESDGPATDRLMRGTGTSDSIQC